MAIDYGDLTKEAKAPKAQTLADVCKALEKFIKNDKRLDNGQPIVDDATKHAAQKTLAAIAA